MHVRVRVSKTEQKEKRDRARQRRTHRLELETWPRTGEENNRFYSTHVSDGYFCFSGDEKDMHVEVLALKHGHVQMGQERCDDTFRFMTFSGLKKIMKTILLLTSKLEILSQFYNEFFLLP